MFICSFLFGLECILDDEIEIYSKRIVDTLAKKAGVQYDVPLYILHCIESNAAAITQSAIVVYSGLVLETKSPEEFVGVLAHEMGHIKSMHIMRYKMMPHPVLIGIGVGLGAATAALTGGLGLFVALFGVQVSYREQFRQMRIEELQADRTAVHILESLGWPTDGLKSFLSRLLYKDYLIQNYDLGLSTHPLSRDRLNKLMKILKQDQGKLPDWVSEGFLRIRSKIRGYLKKDIDASDLYEQTVALFFRRNFSKALYNINLLLTKAPQDIYYLELKGDILCAMGELKQSLEYYEKAYALKGSLKYLPLKLASVLIHLNMKIDFAIKILKRTLLKNNNIGYIWHLLGRAYTLKQQKGNVFYCQVEEAFTKRDWKLLQYLLKERYQKPELKEFQHRLDDIKSILSSFIQQKK